jgi:hypothetical protein
MIPRSDELERDLLILFQRSCRCNRMDIAEHLLRAIEASSGTEADLCRANKALVDAYRGIARSRPKGPASARSATPEGRGRESK